MDDRLDDPRVVLLKDKYRVGERIGAGAMAAVFAGTHVVTERPIAIKRLLPDRIRDDKAIARFEREARAAGRIRSEHVVEVLDFDRDDQGLPFLVLERLFGETLAERMRKQPALCPPEAIEVAAQTLAGVADMHRVGVVHRDIKPSNVFLCRDPSGLRVKLVDFGVAKLTDERAPHLTNVDELLGSFSFTAPEQLRNSGEAGPAADLWSVGVLLHRMLANELPFAAGDPGSVMAAVLERPAPRLVACGVDPEVAAHVQPIVDRALQKRPDHRYPSAEQMRADLLAAIDAFAPLEPAQGPPAATAAFDAVAADPEVADDAPTPQPSAPEPLAPLRAAAKSSTPLLLAVLLLGGIGGWLASGARARGEDRPIEASSLVPVRVATDPETAEVLTSGTAVPRHGPRGEAVVEVGAAGALIDVSAAGYISRQLQLPARAASVLVRLERASEVQPAPVGSTSPVAPAETPSTNDDDIEVVTDVPRSGARPRVRPTSRPERSAAPAVTATGAAPAPIRTAPY